MAGEGCWPSSGSGPAGLILRRPCNPLRNKLNPFGGLTRPGIEKEGWVLEAGRILGKERIRSPLLWEQGREPIGVRRVKVWPAMVTAHTFSLILA